jgi:hypothetical protein
MAESWAKDRKLIATQAIKHIFFTGNLRVRVSEPRQKIDRFD